MKGHHDEDPRDRLRDPAGLTRIGAWGTVVSVDDGQVTVSVSDFDQDAHYFGPVRYIGATPEPGSRAFLHFDWRDRPAYAAIFD